MSIRFSKNIALLLLSGLFLVACANKPLVITKGTNLSDLQICLGFANHLDGDEKLLYLDAVSAFINDYNASQSHLTLKACRKGLQKSLHVTVQNTRLIDPKKQAFYIIVSTIGIAYPLSGGSIGFAWFAMNGTSMQLQLSADMGGESKPVHRSFSSWPYFYDLETIKVKHMAQFKGFMLETIVDIEKSLETVQM